MGCGVGARGGGRGRGGGAGEGGAAGRCRWVFSALGDGEWGLQTGSCKCGVRDGSNGIPEGCNVATEAEWRL